MTILLLLIPLSLALLGVAVWAFVWAVRRGQFDDLDSAALDILADDRPPAPRPDASPPKAGQDRSDSHAD
jgi:cbb3-type cytochrome oxidase maturation protein